MPALGNSGVDYYVGNCHKWLCAPRGAALLWAKRGLRWGADGDTDTGGSGGSGDASEIESSSSNSSYSSNSRVGSYPTLRPAIVSHGYGDGAWSAFAWDGCRDYGAALSIPPLLRFWGVDADGAADASYGGTCSKNHGNLSTAGGDLAGGGGGGRGVQGGSIGVGRARALAYNRSLLRDACQLLRDKWVSDGGGLGFSPRSFQGPMALVALPESTWRTPGLRGAAGDDEEEEATSADAKRIQVSWWVNSAIVAREEKKRACLLLFSFFLPPPLGFFWCLFNLFLAC